MYQQAVITIFMLLFGVNFNVYYLLLIRRPKDAGRCEELRGYLAVVAIAILLITINIRSLFPSLFMAFHQAAFQVSSIITTRDTFMPPPVLPAQAPINMMSSRIVLENSGQLL